MAVMNKICLVQPQLNFGLVEGFQQVGHGMCKHVLSFVQDEGS